MQKSATSHTPAAPLHCVAAGRKVSAGQSLFTPSQFSAMSQSPADALHSALDFASAGHVALEPVHVSAMSQTPALALHSVEIGKNWSVGQLLFVPSQFSAVSHIPADALHCELDFVSAGHVALEPVQ